MDGESKKHLFITQSMILITLEYSLTACKQRIVHHLCSHSYSASEIGFILKIFSTSGNFTFFRENEVFYFHGYFHFCGELNSIFAFLFHSFFPFKHLCSFYSYYNVALAQTSISHHSLPLTSDP